MKQSEKQRLIDLTRAAVDQITCEHPKIKASAQKAAAKYSPTNAESFRLLAVVVWWLFAADSAEDAARLLDALCEVNDEFYWTFHSLGSAFATRAWLHAKRKDAAAARRDARSALAWIHRDPNARPVTESEVRGSLEQFDERLGIAETETGAMMSLRCVAHAMRALVMYQQFAKAGDPACKAIPAKEFTTRMNAGLREMRRRLEAA